MTDAPSLPAYDVPAAYRSLLERLVLPHQLEDIHRRLARAFDLDAQQHADHSESTLRVLLCIRLAPEGTIRATDLSEQLVKSTSHTSRLIDRAEAGGLVERQADPNDRRAQLIALTPLGTRAIDAYVPHAAALLGEAFGDVLSPGEFLMLIGFLDRVRTATSGVVTRLERDRRS
jgi:DNA-binding MarR family transcriptional regulator